MRLIRRIRDKERGAVLLWVAGAMVVLLTSAAFATDLGWILLQNSRLQAAADSAALAGVVNLPGFPSDATADATTASGVNGFPIGGDTTLADTVLADNTYEVTLASPINTFFLKLIGMDQVTLRRSSTAQYIKPVRLGSADNGFGGPAENFWAAINGQYTEIQQGDPYAAQCVVHNSIGAGPGCQNSSPTCVTGQTGTCYRPGGYYYGIEIGPNSQSLRVRFYDGGHYVDNSGSGTSDPTDTSWRWGWPDGQRGVNLEYALYPPDATPNDPTDNSTNAAAECADVFPVNGPPGAGHFNRWNGSNNCNVGGALTQGIWVLQLPSPLWEGATKFGIEATVSQGPAPKVYGLLDMSLYVNFNGDHAEPYLAEIRPEHANKTLEVDIWDLGDVDGDADIRFIDPIGGDGNPPACWWTSTNGESAGSAGSPLSDCVIDIGDQRFNAEWLNVSLPIPDGYTCNIASNGCWWKIHIFSDSQAHDRTTWAARVVGDPVKLVK